VNLAVVGAIAGAGLISAVTALGVLGVATARRLVLELAPRCESASFRWADSVDETPRSTSIEG